MAGGDGGLGGLLGGNSVITQLFLYGVASEVLTALLAPFITAASSKVNSTNPLVPESPPDLAEMVVKNILTEEAAAAEAAKSGENAERFHHRVLNTGEPPGLETVLQWWRRGFIPWDSGGPGAPSVVNALRTSRIYDYWIDTVHDAQFMPITAADAVNAWVRGEISEPDALQYLYVNGLKEKEARILYNTVGRPPAPMQLATLVHRGLIPVHGRGPDVTSFEQGIIEGDEKDKWEPLYEGLIENIPGVFQIRQAQLAGGLTAEQAAHYYALNGLPRDLVAGMVAAGSGRKLEGSRKLAQSVIESLYVDKFIDRAQAVAMLQLLGYDDHEAEYVLDVVDYKVVAESETAAITKTRAAFLARHITVEQTREILTELGVPVDRQRQLVQLWEDERGATVRILTEAQIVDAVDLGIATQEWGMERLQGIGYSAVDAWVLLSIKAKGPLPGAPAGAPVPPPKTSPPPATPTSTGG